MLTKNTKHRNGSVWIDKRHEACWQLINGHWKMTPAFHTLWLEYNRGQISRATFFRRQRELKCACDER